MIGVYQIINTVNNKIYFGQSLNIEQRFRNHKRSLNKGNSSNIYLQWDWNKYGESSFQFDVIELCPSDITDPTEIKQWLNDTEEFYIEAHLNNNGMASLYNIAFVKGKPNRWNTYPTWENYIHEYTS